MKLIDFKKHIKQAEKGKVFEYGISEPFSWRGMYSEVAFEILKQPMTREKILSNIGKAYTGTFHGYKGGTYVYFDNSIVNFEEDECMWSDGEYVARMIAKIENRELEKSQEMRLVKLAFS